jgi:hypothetical protein
MQNQRRRENLSLDDTSAAAAPEASAFTPHPEDKPGLAQRLQASINGSKLDLSEKPDYPIIPKEKTREMEELYSKYPNPTEGDIWFFLKKILGNEYFGLTAEHIPQILRFLDQHPEITELDLSSKPLGDHYHPAYDSVYSNRMRNRIGDKGALLLAKNTTICILRLTFNEISNVGASALTDNTTIEQLFLDHNGITETKGIIKGEYAANEFPSKEPEIPQPDQAALTAPPIASANAQDAAPKAPSSAAAPGFSYAAASAHASPALFAQPAPAVQAALPPVPAQAEAEAKAAEDQPGYSPLQ